MKKTQSDTQFTRSIGGGADKAMVAPPVALVIKPKAKPMVNDPMPKAKVAGKLKPKPAKDPAAKAKPLDNLGADDADLPASKPSKLPKIAKLPGKLPVPRTPRLPGLS